MAETPFIDARKWATSERRTALLRMDGEAIMFTASWGRSSSLVPRPDGAYRRLLLVHLEVPDQHRERSFQDVRFLTLFALGKRESVSTDDIAGVYKRDLNTVTLSIYLDNWH